MAKVKDVPCYDEEDAGPVAKSKKKKVKASTRKAVKKKSSKKEPAGVAIPFKQPSSMIHQVFKMCMQGAKIEKVKKFVEAQSGDPRGVLRKLRRETKYGKKWKVEESKGYIKIHYPV